MKGAFTMNNITIDTTRKELNDLIDGAANFLDNLQKVVLMLVDILDTIDTTEPVPALFVDQAATKAHIATDYALKARDDAQSIFNKICSMKDVPVKEG